MGREIPGLPVRDPAEENLEDQFVFSDLPGRERANERSRPVVLLGAPDRPEVRGLARDTAKQESRGPVERVDGAGLVRPEVEAGELPL